MGNSDSTENKKLDQKEAKEDQKKTTETSYWGATWDLTKPSNEEEDKKRKKK